MLTRRGIKKMNTTEIKARVYDLMLEQGKLQQQLQVIENEKQKLIEQINEAEKEKENGTIERI